MHGDFDDLMQDRLVVVKKNGMKFEVAHASVQKQKIIVIGDHWKFEEGDEIQRPLKNGMIEFYVVVDPNYHSGIEGIEGHFELQVRRKGSSDYSHSTPSIHIHGDNARVNLHSVDNSQNASTKIHDMAVFQLLKSALEEQVKDGERQKALIEKVEGMKSAVGTPGFLDRYKEFISLAADHMTLEHPLSAN